MSIMTQASSYVVVVSGFLATFGSLARRRVRVRVRVWKWICKHS